MELVKVLILAVIISLLSVLLKQIKAEYSIICIVVGSVILLAYILNSVTDVFNYFSLIMDKTGIDSSMFKTLIKIIGIGYLVEFSSNVCLDSGNKSIADKVVLAGKLLIFTISIPIVTHLFNLVMELI